MFRRAAFVALLFVVVLATPAAAQTTPTTEPPKADGCGFLGFKPPSAVCGVADFTGDVVAGRALRGVVGNAAGDAVSGVAEAVGETGGNGLTKWMAAGAVWLMGEIGEVVMRTTSPNLEAPWAVENYDRMAAIGALLLAPFLLAAIVRGVRTNDLGSIVRAVGIGVPGAVLFTATAVAIVQILIVITDGMSVYIASNMDRDLQRFIEGPVQTVSNGAGLTSDVTSAVVPTVLIFIGALLLGIAALVIWIELIMRSAAIYVVVAFLPLVFAASVWPAAAKWTRRSAEVLLAIIVSKFVIVAIVALAAAALGSGAETGYAGLLGASAALGLAAFTPKALLQLVPIADAATSSPGRGTLPSATRTMTGQMAVRRIMTQRAIGASSGGGAAKAPSLAAAGVGAAAGGAAKAAGTAVKSGVGKSSALAVPGRIGGSTTGAVSGPSKSPSKATPSPSEWRPTANTPPSSPKSSPKPPTPKGPSK